MRVICHSVLSLIVFLIVSCGDGSPPLQSTPAGGNATSSVELRVTIVTRFKQDTSDYSSAQPSHKFCNLPAGSKIIVTSAVVEADDNHIQVTLAETLPQCSLKSGYLFTRHLDSESLANALKNRGQTVGGPQLGVNRRLLEFYSVRENAQKVYDNVMSWYGSTSNGCVAFLSTALRMSGYSIAQKGYFNGERISLVTLPFYRYLESKGFRRITKSAELLPGDIVLTKENDSPGYPAHTYMFHSWSNQAQGIGNIIDNQSFRVSNGKVISHIHERNIFASGSKTRAAFALRL